MKLLLIVRTKLKDIREDIVEEMTMGCWRE